MTCGMAWASLECLYLFPNPCRSPPTTDRPFPSPEQPQVTGRLGENRALIVAFHLPLLPHQRAGLMSAFFICFLSFLTFR